MNKYYYILLFALVFLLFPIFIIGKQIDLLEQYKIIENLKSIFAILFALFGIWIAICNPLTSESDKLKNIDFNKILEALFLCIVSLIFIGIIYFLIPTFKNITYIQEKREIFRAILFSSLYILTLIQIYTLIIALRPNNLIKVFIDNRDTGEDIIKKQRILKKD